MKKSGNYFLLLLLPFIVAISCSKDDSGRQDHDEDHNNNVTTPIPDTVTFTNGYLTYNADDIGSGESDLWILSMYTDMEIDDVGNPIGPGHLMRISLNAPYNEDQEPLLEKLSCRYIEQSSTGDFSSGTFNTGYYDYIDLPSGRIEVPSGSFYGELEPCKTDFEADLLREGYVQIDVLENEILRVEGILVGICYTKRYFRFEGNIEIIDESPEEIPNTTLTEDIDLSCMTQIKMSDMGDYFFLGDNSYKMFVIYFAQQGVDLSGSKPKGDGKVLRVDLFVPWDATIEDGIPEGEYTMAKQESNGGMSRSEIVPFKIVPGYPDTFTNYSATLR